MWLTAGRHARLTSTAATLTSTAATAGGFLQSVLLAGPGVVIGAVLMGVFAKFMLPYDWSWNLAMVFGSILSATDPVAVVALLKSAGASPKLTILIVGESLLNDGTAMVSQ